MTVNPVEAPPGSYPAELWGAPEDEAFQGRGGARQLFERLALEFRKQDIRSFKIVAGNQLLKANRFYQKMGCKKVGECEVHAGEGSSVYVFEGGVG